MDQWQTQLRDALQNRDIDTAKNLLFAAYFQTEGEPGTPSSSLVKGDLSSSHITQVIDDLDPDTQRYVQDEIQNMQK